MQTLAVAKFDLLYTIYYIDILIQFLDWEDVTLPLMNNNSKSLRLLLLKFWDEGIVIIGSLRSPSKVVGTGASELMAKWTLWSHKLQKRVV